MSDYWWQTRSKKFFSISQGNSTVEMYERRFFQLKKYSGWLENDKPLVQHFIRGLNPKIGEEVRTFKPKIAKEAADQAKLTELKSGFLAKGSVNPPAQSSGKSQKPYQDNFKAFSSGSSGKFQKRKFEKFSKSTRVSRFLSNLSPLNQLGVYKRVMHHLQRTHHRIKVPREEQNVGNVGNWGICNGIVPFEAIIRSGLKPQVLRLLLVILEGIIISLLL